MAVERTSPMVVLSIPDRRPEESPISVKTGGGRKKSKKVMRFFNQY